LKLKIRSPGFGEKITAICFKFAWIFNAKQLIILFFILACISVRDHSVASEGMQCCEGLYKKGQKLMHRND